MDRATCGMCLSPLLDPDEDTGTVDVVATPCGHVYHRSCVALWLVNKGACPQCRVSCVIDVLRPVILAGMEGSEQPGTNSGPATPLQFAVERKKALEAKKHSADAEVAEISDAIDQVKGKTSELRRSTAQSEAKVRETEDRIARVDAQIEQLQKKADRNYAEEVVQSFFAKQKEESERDAEMFLKEKVI